MYFKQKILAKTLGTLALICSPALAIAAQSQDSGGWSWSAHIANLNMDSKVAEEQGVNDSIFVLGAAAERYFTGSDFTFSLGLDLLLFDDKDGFSNQTTGGRKSSSASGGMLFAEYGTKINFGENHQNFVEARAGYSGLLSASRSISYCDGCDSEDIEFDGGTYGLLGVGHSFTSFDLGLQFQQYFSGDLDNSLRLKISTVF